MSSLSEKEWDAKITSEDKLWAYNCRDCVYTREVGEVLTETIKKLGLEEVDKLQQALFHPVLKAMLRGVRVLPGVKGQMAEKVQEELSKREAFLYNILGHSINPKSPKQMQSLFYEDLKQPIIYKRIIKDGRPKMAPTVDDEALTKIGNREPLLRPLCNAIADIRTLHKFYNDFIMMPVDTDGRMRCSFNIAGDAGGKSAPYSYRLSSSKNPFGTGGNLQTIPSEKSKSAGKAKARGSLNFELPNIRSMYGPDDNFTFFDMDLDRADLQVVAWEANDPLLKAALKAGTDMHLMNVFILDGKDPPPLEELVERHAKDEVCTCGPRCYWDYRTPRSHKREFAKVFCHASNYLGGAKTVAEHTGRSVQEVDRAQKIYFGRYATIHQWHKKVEQQVLKYRFVENRWGYRWYIFDRLDNILKDAVAWLPQSTVGITINKIWLSIYENLPEVQVLLQVHDSLAGQFPTHRRELILPLMKKYSEIVIPYEDPLVIPTGIGTSEVSWGEC